MNVSRGLSAIVHHHRRELFGEHCEALFEVGQLRCGSRFVVVGVGGESSARSCSDCCRACARRLRLVSMIAMMSGGRSLPSSVPVMARNSNRAATRLLPWPKLSWTVMNGVVAASIGLSKVTVMCAGPSCVGVGRPAVFVAGVEDVFGAIVWQPGVGGDCGDVEQAVEIHLVAGDGFGAGGEGGEDERAFDFDRAVALPCRSSGSRSMSVP